MNILLWNSWVTPAGGMERVVLSLANGLAERPHNRVVLMGPYQTVPALRERISSKVHFEPCRFERRPGTILQNWLQLRQLTSQYGIQVVSAHGSLLPLLPLGVPWCGLNMGRAMAPTPSWKAPNG